MRPEEFDRVALPVSVILVFLLTFAWPMWRHRRLTGSSAIAVGWKSTGAERALSAALMVACAALIAGTILVAAGGTAMLGVTGTIGTAWALGWLLALAGLALIVAAQAQMGRSWRIGIDRAPTALVTGGLFRVIRNPIYTGMALMIVALILILPSVTTAVAAIMACLLLAAQARVEERHLLRMHGATYLDYASRVGRFLPGIGRLRGSVQGG